MSREITTHKVNGCNDALKIEVRDEPGSGGANHVYDITPTAGNARGIRIEFQNGPLKETDFPNGITHEVLLAIVADRLKCFQAGPYACEENYNALQAVEEAMRWLCPMFAVSRDLISSVSAMHYKGERNREQIADWLEAQGQ